MLQLVTTAVFGLVVGGLCGLFWIAIRDGNVPAASNAAVCLVLVIVPVAIELGVTGLIAQQAGLYPRLPLAIGTVSLFHVYGMLGPYDEIWWWDHLTHTLAAGVLAAIIASGLPVLGVTDPVHHGLLVLGLTGLVGVFWEVIELVAREVGRTFDIEPVLVHYGWRDTALDLGFDLLGAVAVVVLGLQPFYALAATSPDRVRWLFDLVFGTLVGGIVLLSVVVLVLQRGGR